MNTKFKILIVIAVLIAMLGGCSKRVLPDEESITVQLSWPENDEVLLAMSSNLNWAPFPGHSYYRVMVWAQGDSEPLIDDITRGSSYTVEYELSDGAYDWAVCVRDGDDDIHCSDTMSFHLSQVVVNTVPPMGRVINDIRVYFDWMYFPQANGYNIKVWKEDDPSHIVFDELAFSSSVKANVPFFNGNYCWTVGTRYADEAEFGRWSDTLCFEIVQYPWALIDTMHTRADPRDVLPFMDALYVGDGHAGFLIADRSDPRNPTPISWDEPSGQDISRAIWADSIRKIVAVSDYRGTHPVLFYDATTPTAAVWSDWSGIWGRKNQDIDGIWFNDTLFIAIADYDDGAFLFDMSDTVYQSVATRGRFTPEGYTYGVALADSFIFIVTGNRGIYIAHMNDPATQVGWVDTPGEAEKCDIKGTYCYVADGIGGLVVVDFSDPTNPFIVATDNPQVGSAQKVRVEGNYCYVAYGSGGARIYDISTPTNPVVVQEIDGMYLYSAASDGDILYIADRDWGIMVLER